MSRLKTVKTESAILKDCRSVIAVMISIVLPLPLDIGLTCFWYVSVYKLFTTLMCFISCRTNHNPRCFGSGVVQIKRLHFYYKFTFFWCQNTTWPVFKKALKWKCIQRFLKNLLDFYHCVSFTNIQKRGIQCHIKGNFWLH